MEIEMPLHSVKSPLRNSWPLELEKFLRKSQEFQSRYGRCSCDFFIPKPTMKADRHFS